ncbi:MAG: hypothetical protein Q8L92_06925, partial [Rubrivivax sp.]|nr:hypothetical protein [Rubrivivax sp.]
SQQQEVQDIAGLVVSGGIQRSNYRELAAYSAKLAETGARNHIKENYQEVCETVRVQMIRAMIEALLNFKWVAWREG